MEATTKACQGMMEDAVNTVWSKFLETISNRAEGFFVSVGQRTHSLRKEPDTQIQRAR
jgi:hypothetical protein